MKKIRNYNTFTIFITISSCGTVKEAFSTQKKKQWWVFSRKKNPLILPPDFSELPEPKSQNLDEDNDQQIKNLIINKDNPSSIDAKGSSSKTLRTFTWQD